MDTNASDDSATLDVMRKTAISRRGGVRVRGGRLPPIRIRDVVKTTTKKSVAPKIPQRRIKVEKESPESFPTTSSSFSQNERKDSRKTLSRGRGPRVYIQTEGSFLGQGPAARLKKETAAPRYERTARSSSRMLSLMDSKINPWQIDMILEGNEENDFSGEENDMQPIRLPIVKKNLTPKTEMILDGKGNKLKIKEEIEDNEENPLDEDDNKPKIKEEILDNEENQLNVVQEILNYDDVLSKIKKEPEEDTGETELNRILPDVKINQEKKGPKICRLLEALKLSQEEDVFVVFQLPSCLPFQKCDENSDKKSKKDAVSSSELDGNVENLLEESRGTNFMDLLEGSVGKLQIMKSGRIHLTLGSVDMAIESGVNEGSTADVVSIALDNKNGGHFTVIGGIYEKMMIYPILTKSERNAKKEVSSD